MTQTGKNAQPTVVVGYDGSSHAQAAVRYAIGEAARHGMRVRVIVAHEPPDAWAAGYGMPVLADSGEIRRTVEEAARTRIEALRGELDPAGREVPVEVRAITGPAGAVLVAEARDADRLIVGHRGRGGVRSVLLGSVGLSVVMHAPCPVTVVPLPRPPGDAPDDGASDGVSGGVSGGVGGGATVVAGPLPDGSSA